MFKVLIYGLTSNYGGIEMLLFNLCTKANNNDIKFYFIENKNSDIAFKQKMIDLGFSIVTLSLNRRRKYLQYKKNIYELFKKNKFDTFVQVLGDLSNIDFLVAAKKFKVKNIFAYATMGKQISQISFIRKVLIKHNTKKITKICRLLSVSKSASIETFGFYNDHICLLQPGIDLEKFEFNSNARIRIREDLSIPEDAVVFGDFGRLCEEKNQMFLLKLFEKYQTFNRNSFLVLVGLNENNYKNQLVQYCNNNKISNVIILDPKSNINEYYSAIDVFFTPSLREGFGLVVIEAQTSGCFTLAFDEVIEKNLFINKNAYLVQNDLEKSYKILISNDVQKREYDATKLAKFDIRKSSTLFRNLVIGIDK